jgi:hypothetical protein
VNAEEKADEVARKLWKDCCGLHKETALCFIVEAILAFRNEGLEEAAKVAKLYEPNPISGCSVTLPKTASLIGSASEAILALKSPSQKEA